MNVVAAFAGEALVLAAAAAVVAWIARHPGQAGEDGPAPGETTEYSSTQDD